VKRTPPSRCPLQDAASAGNEYERMNGRFQGYGEIICQRFPTRRHPGDHKPGFTAARSD
jgi:hypothetical protein